MQHLVNKIRSDLFQYKSQNSLAIASIAVGVFWLGTLLGMMDIQLAQMDKAHIAAKPAHITLILRAPAKRSFLPTLQSLEEVAGVATQSQVTVRYRKLNSSDWQLASLITEPDYLDQRYDVIELQEGQWPKQGEIALERMSARYLDIPLNTTLAFETINQNAISLKVTGIIRQPFVKPPRFGGQPYFLINESAAQQFGIAPDSFNKLLVQVKPPYSIEKARAVATTLRLLFFSEGINVSATLLQDPEKHWGRVFFEGLNKIFAGMAWASLALACVLIFNTVTAHMSEQTNQIGIMKAMGASRTQLISIYLLEFFLLALLAVLVAVPVSLCAAYFASYWLLSLFNIVMPDFIYSLHSLLIMVVGGLILPLFSAGLPIYIAVNRTVRYALDTFGVGSDFKPTRLDVFIEKVSSLFFSTLYVTAIVNMFRKKLRLLWSLTILTLTGVVFIVILSLRSSINLTLDNELTRTTYDVRLGFLQDQSQAQLNALLHAQSNTLSVEYWQRLPVELSYKTDTPLRQIGSLGLQLVALPVSSQLYKPYIDSGRWLNEEDLGQRHLVLSADTAQQNHLKEGDSITVNVAGQQQSWLIIGTYRWLAGANFVVEPVYAPLDTITNMTHRNDSASYALISASVANQMEEQTYVSQLQQLFWNKGIKLDIFTTLAKLEQRQFAKAQFFPITAMLFGLAAMIAAIAGIGMAGSLAISVLQRKREIAVLRAIGGNDGAIFRLFMFEGVCQGIFSWFLTIPVAYLIAKPATQCLGKILFGIVLDFQFDGWACWLWLLGVITLTCLATWWPARQAVKISINQSIVG